MKRTVLGLLMGMCLMGIFLCLMWSDMENLYARLERAGQVISAMEADAEREAEEHARDLNDMEAQMATLTTQQATLAMEREALLMENASLRLQSRETMASVTDLE